MTSRLRHYVAVAGCVLMVACDNEIRCTYRGATLMGVESNGLIFHHWVFGHAVLGGELNANVLPSIAFVLGDSNVRLASLKPPILLSVGARKYPVRDAHPGCAGASTVYVVNGGFMYFEADRLVCVVVRGDWERKGGLSLAPPGSATRFEFPLDESEAKALFGEPSVCVTSHYSG